jgi:sulfate transport system permease protein
LTFKRLGVLPGFGLSLGYVLFHLGLLVLWPVAALLLRAARITPAQFWELATEPRALAAYRLSFGADLAAALVNTVFGVPVAWLLARFRLPGKTMLDALVDLPFALPTAVAGIALTSVYSEHGVVGSWLASVGVKVAYTRLGVIAALTFVGIPFVVRTLQPIIEALDLGAEEAAAVLGASRLQTLRRVVLPALLPAILTGFALAFARGLGEYGSVVFISGNMPMRTEIAPLLIVTKLEQYDYAGATAIATIMLGAAFALLLAVNALGRWTARSAG